MAIEGSTVRLNSPVAHMLCKACLTVSSQHALQTSAFERDTSTLHTRCWQNLASAYPPVPA